MLQQEEERRERRSEQETERRLKRQHREWIAAERCSQGAQHTQRPMIEYPASTRVPLSAVASSHLFNNRSPQGTLGASAGVPSSNSLDGHAPMTTSGGSRVIAWVRRSTPGLPTDSRCQASYTSRLSRRRLQRRNRSHSLTAWLQPGSPTASRGSLDPVAAPAPAHTVPSFRLERQSQTSIVLASNRSNRSSHHRLLGEA